jgi:hypothetical protein
MPTSCIMSADSERSTFNVPEAAKQWSFQVDVTWDSLATGASPLR